jgi:hypothetical protein
MGLRKSYQVVASCKDHIFDNCAFTTLLFPSYSYPCAMNLYLASSLSKADIQQHQRQAYQRILHHFFKTPLKSAYTTRSILT